VQTQARMLGGGGFFYFTCGSMWLKAVPPTKNGIQLVAASREQNNAS